MGGRGAKGLGKTIRNKKESSFNSDGSLTDKAVSILESNGFKRWQKNGKDRMYISPYDLGLNIKWRGAKPSYGLPMSSVESSFFDGEIISHSEALRLYNTKIYVDVKTGNIYTSETNRLKPKLEKVLSTLLTE